MKKKLISMLLIMILLLSYSNGIFAANTIKNDYQCKACGHKFS